MKYESDRIIISKDSKPPKNVFFSFSSSPKENWNGRENKSNP